MMTRPVVFFEKNCWRHEQRRNSSSITFGKMNCFWASNKIWVIYDLNHHTDIKFTLFSLLWKNQLASLFIKKNWLLRNDKKIPLLNIRVKSHNQMLKNITTKPARIFIKQLWVVKGGSNIYFERRVLKIAIICSSKNESN